MIKKYEYYVGSNHVYTRWDLNEERYIMEENPKDPTNKEVFRLWLSGRDIEEISAIYHVSTSEVQRVLRKVIMDKRMEERKRKRKSYSRPDRDAFTPEE